MLATVDTMNTSSSSTKATSSSESSSNDMRHSIRKNLRVNAILADEPTTPHTLNTPSTCTKNLTFFTDYPTSLQATPATGTTFLNLNQPFEDFIEEMYLLTVFFINYVCQQTFRLKSGL